MFVMSIAYAQDAVMPPKDDQAKSMNCDNGKRSLSREPGWETQSKIESACFQMVIPTFGE